MPDLTSVRNTVIDNIAAQIDTWIAASNDTDLKAFLRTVTNIDDLSMAQIKGSYETYMGGTPEEDAYDQLLDALEEGEEVDKIVFGTASNITTPEVTEELRGKLMPIKHAERYMHGWKLVDESADAPTYNIRIWTTHRVLWTKIAANGSVELTSVERGPEPVTPTQP